MTGVHLVSVPIQTPLSVARRRFEDARVIRQTIETAGTEAAPGARGLPDPVEATRVDAVTDVAHDIFGALVAGTRERNADLLLMGWHGGLTVGRIRRTPVQRVMREVKADMAVLNDRGLDEIGSILIPWGGGPHARLGLELAVRVARATGAEVHVLRLVRPDVELEGSEARLRGAVEAIVGLRPDLRYHVRRATSVSDGIRSWTEEHRPGLLIIGASSESGIRSVLFGTVPDVVADEAPCSVLMVRRFLPRYWTLLLGERVKRIWERLGRTSSPEEPG